VFVLSVAAILRLLLGATAAGVELWALVDALIRPAPAFRAAGKASKTLWVALTAVAVAIGALGVLPGGGLPGFGGIAAIAALVIAIVYLVDVRPAVRGPRRPPTRPSGPTGGW
jgi:hypothetical protein